jgi:hypothetical protein
VSKAIIISTEIGVQGWKVIILQMTTGAMEMEMGARAGTSRSPSSSTPARAPMETRPYASIYLFDG